MAKERILAASVTVALCDGCDGMHIYFMDEEGEVVAEGILGGLQLAGHANDVLDIASQLLDQQDPIGECAGRA